MKTLPVGVYATIEHIVRRNEIARARHVLDEKRRVSWNMLSDIPGDQMRTSTTRTLIPLKIGLLPIP